jgi:hypothetical protein
MPVFAAAAAATAAIQLQPLAAFSSSSSSSRAADAEHQIFAQDCSGCTGLDVSQLAAQLGGFCGAPSNTLPWLQLLARYHALAAAPQQGQQQRQQQEQCSGDKPEQRVTAMCATLQSLGAGSLPPLLELLLQLIRENSEEAGEGSTGGKIMSSSLITPLT